MASQVSIANRALALLGANTINAFDDGSTEANIIRAIYDDARDAVLRSAPWLCAKFRTSLAQNTTNPLFEWEKSYKLPTDPYCLRVLSLNESDEWRVEGRNLLTNTNSAHIVYIGRVTDPGLFDPSLVWAIATRVAYESCYAITQNRSLTNDMFALSQQALEDAQIADGAEERYHDIISDDLHIVRL